MCLLQVKYRRPPHTGIWSVTQSSLQLANTWELTFGKNDAPQQPVLPVVYQHIGLYLLVTCKISAATKHLQKSACVQAGIYTKTSQTHAWCQDKHSFRFDQQLRK